jgi:peptidyl-prolyl cis-trans isomerase SurA
MRRWLWISASVGFLGLLGIPATPAHAAERIAAIVNKDVILESDVDDQTHEAALRMHVDPSDSLAMARLHKDVLNQLVERQVLLAEAARLAITVPAQDVAQETDKQMATLKQRFASPQEFQAALAQEHTSEAEVRKRYETGVREQLTIQRLVGKEVQSKTTVNDAEIRTYYEAHKDSLGKKPETLKLAHILIAFEPDSMQVRRSRMRADSLRAQVVKGAAFEMVAQMNSDDPSSKVGGDLGTFGRGDMVPEFEAAAFSLKPMEISQPIRTRFGYHIIQVLEHMAATDSLPERIHARHIMVQIKPSDADEERARKKALAVRDSIVGGANFAAMARRYSADTATKDSGGVLGDIPVPSLPPNMQEALTGLRVGEVSVPFKREAGFHLFKLLGRTPQSDYVFADIKEDLRQIVLNQKLEEAYRRWYERIRKTVNVELKD